MGGIKYSQYESHLLRASDIIYGCHNLIQYFRIRQLIDAYISYWAQRSYAPKADRTNRKSPIGKWTSVDVVADLVVPEASWLQYSLRCSA